MQICFALQIENQLQAPGVKILAFQPGMEKPEGILMPASQPHTWTFAIF